MRAQKVGIALALLVAATVPENAHAWDRGRVKIFATLPEGASGPEGLEVDAAGLVYVTTFGFTSTASVPADQLGQLFVFDRKGHLLRQVSITGSSPHLLGLRFHPISGALLVIDFGAGRVLDVDPFTGASKVFMTLPPQLTPGSGLNDITFDHAGNVYVSDSFQGIVWTTGKDGGVASQWVASTLLQTTGVPPFGANGLRFNRAETTLFVANTGNDTIIQIPAIAGTSGITAGTPSVFTNSVNGADGLLVDEDDNLWVVANQADEIVVVDPTGKAIAKLGDFGGGLAHGAPLQMLFPASLRFHGDDLLVTNLSLDLRIFNPAFESVDSEWCAQVSRYTVVKLPAQLHAKQRERDDRDDD